MPESRVYSVMELDRYAEQLERARLKRREHYLTRVKQLRTLYPPRGLKRSIQTNTLDEYSKTNRPAYSCVGGAGRAECEELQIRIREPRDHYTSSRSKEI